MGTGDPTSAPFVGRPLRRREDVRILRGRSRYLDDIEPPGTVHAAFVRSTYARARITALDPPDGAAGLVAVITAADLDGLARPLPIAPVESAEMADEPHPLLPAEEVGYAGQPVVAVLAESRALAEDASELVYIDYDPLEVVVEPRRSDRALSRWRRSAGGAEAAFAAADRVVRAAYALPRVAAVPMETRGAIASYDAAADMLTVWCSAQDSARPLAQLAHSLCRPADRIRVIVPDVGGAFGSKGALPVETVVIAAAAMRLGRPVKWAEDRFENLVGSYQGRGVEADVELALSADGDMLGLRARIYADLGAYLLPTTAVPSHTTAMLMSGVYAIPALDVEVVGARTNKVPVGPYRGAGRPEAAYFVECTVDRAARELGIDPVELRRRNLIAEFPYRSPLGWTYDSGDYERCLDRAVELGRPEREAGPERLVGTGVAMYVERAGGQWESAHVSVEPDGRVVASSGSSPHGQGHETVFAQIAADRLGIDPDRVTLRFGDSAVVPPGVGTFASRSVAMGGSALVVACDKLIDRARPIAAALLDVPADELSWREGGFSTNDGRSATFHELAAAAHEPGRLEPGARPGLEAAARFSSDMVFSSGAYVAVVEIERATAALRVLRLAAVDDAGNIVNPLLAEGQVIGGVAQGLGQALAEQVVHDDQGQQLTANLLDYSLPTAAEMPPIATDFVVSPSPLNPLGAKGIGEGGAIGTPAAVANAVADALGGRHVDPPYTGERFWEALKEETR